MSDLRARIEAVLAQTDPAIIACSGGIDSLLLAYVAHQRAGAKVIVAHAISPAVPPEASARVQALAHAQQWDLRIVQSGEFADEAYLANPVNRCYFCKSNLYDSLQAISAQMGGQGVILSGANIDDLGDYRPGLDAAAEKSVRHPWIEAGFTKADIRTLARQLDLSFAELPASPCLASRLYTGTRVTQARLRAVHACETHIKQRTGLDVVRCRVRDNDMLVEVAETAREHIDNILLGELTTLAVSFLPDIVSVTLDHAPYQPGRAFVGKK